MSDIPSKKNSLREIPTIGGAILTKLDASGNIIGTHTGNTLFSVRIGSEIMLLEEDVGRGLRRYKTREVTGITDNGNGTYDVWTGDHATPKLQSHYVLTFLPQEARRTGTDESGRID